MMTGGVEGTFATVVDQRVWYESTWRTWGPSYTSPESLEYYTQRYRHLIQQRTPTPPISVLTAPQGVHGPSIYVIGIYDDIPVELAIALHEAGDCRITWIGIIDRALDPTAAVDLVTNSFGEDPHDRYRREGVDERRRLPRKGVSRETPRAIRAGLRLDPDLTDLRKEIKTTRQAALRATKKAEDAKAHAQHEKARRKASIEATRIRMEAEIRADLEWEQISRQRRKQHQQQKVLADTARQSVPTAMLWPCGRRRPRCPGSDEAADHVGIERNLVQILTNPRLPSSLHSAPHLGYFDLPDIMPD